MTVLATAVAIVVAPRPAPMPAMQALPGPIGGPSLAASSSAVQAADAPVAGQQPAFRFNQRVGLATFGVGTAGCVAIVDPSLQSGKRLTIAWSGNEEPSRVESATVVAKADSACDSKLGFGVASGAGDAGTHTFYHIRRATDTTTFGAAVAVVDPLAPVFVRAGKVVGDIDGDGALDAIQRCTSSEGVHFRVWTGPWLEGRVRWHRYFYLGYDVVGTCPDLNYFVVSDTVRNYPRSTDPPDERDIFEMVMDHSLGIWLDGKPAAYGDPAFAMAAGRITDVLQPWTVGKLLPVFEQANADWSRRLAQVRASGRNEMWPAADADRQRSADLARLLAGSGDPRAALALGKTLDHPDSPAQAAALDGLFDYFVADINYGVPPERWVELVVGHAYDYTWPAVRRWWSANRPRLERVIGR
jgi:hypothetical protein